MRNCERQIMWRRFLRHIIMIGFWVIVIGAIIGCIFANYSKEENVTAKVISINTRLELGTIRDNPTNASTTYLVSTDKGVFKIEPDGIMASPAFGRLEVGKTYKIHARGVRMETFGAFPYIIEAEEK